MMMILCGKSAMLFSSVLDAGWYFSHLLKKLHTHTLTLAKSHKLGKEKRKKIYQIHTQ